MSALLRRIRTRPKTQSAEASPPTHSNVLNELEDSYQDAGEEDKRGKTGKRSSCRKMNDSARLPCQSRRRRERRRSSFETWEAVASGMADAVSSIDSHGTMAITSSTPKPDGAPTFLAQRSEFFSSGSERGQEDDVRELENESDRLSSSSSSLVFYPEDEMSSSLAMAWQLPEAYSCSVACRRVLEKALAEREAAIGQNALLASQLRLMTARRDHYARRYYRATETCERLKGERGALAQELELVHRQQNVLMAALKQINSRTPCREDDSCPPSLSPTPTVDDVAGQKSDKFPPLPLIDSKLSDARDAAPKSRGDVVLPPHFRSRYRKSSSCSSIVFSESGETGYASSCDLPVRTSPETSARPLRNSMNSQQRICRSRSGSWQSGCTEKLGVLLDMCRRFEQDLLGAMSEMHLNTTETSFSASLSRGVSQASLTSQQSFESLQLGHGDTLRLGSIIAALNKLSQFGSTVSLQSACLGQTDACSIGLLGNPLLEDSADQVADERLVPDTYVTHVDEELARREALTDDAVIATNSKRQRCDSTEVCSVCASDNLRAELPRSRLSDFVSHVTGRGHDDDSLVDQEIKHIFGPPGTGPSTPSQETKCTESREPTSTSYRCMCGRKISGVSPQHESETYRTSDSVSSRGQIDDVDCKPEAVVLPGKVSLVSNSLGDALLRRLSSASQTSGQMLTGQNEVRLSGMTESDLQELVAEMTMPSTNLRKIEIISSSLDFERLLLLSSALRQNSTVTHLSLRHSIILCLGAELLASAIRQTSRIECLELDWNELGDLGIQAMSSSLQRAESLEQLSLGRQSFTDGAAGTIKDIISGSRALRRVSVHGKQFNEQSRQMLRTAARHYNVEVLLEALEDATPIHAPLLFTEKEPPQETNNLISKFGSLSSLKALPKPITSRTLSHGSIFRRRRPLSCIARPTSPTGSRSVYVLSTREKRANNKNKRASAIY